MIFELKIELIDIDPKIWRTFQVHSEILLYDLHQIIQTLFGWTNSHLHSFRISDIEYSLPEYNYDNHIYADSRSYKLKDFPEDSFEYLYDFGDYWEHSIQVLRRIEGKKLLNPICIDGQGNCPPEDVGGIPGFMEFKKIMDDELHPERDSYIEWYGSVYDPDKINLEETNKNLAKRIK